MIVGSGADNHLARLKRLSGDILRRNIEAGLVGTAQIIKDDAVDSINDGAILGPGHIPSIAPSPPNSDTLALVTSADSGPIHDGDEGSEVGAVAAYVSFGGPLAPYAVDQELGNSQLEERPYLRPATERARKTSANRLKDAIAKTALGK